jgi:hypothetical protein
MASTKQKEISERRAALVRALHAQPDHQFTPSELKDLTGVPKGQVRKLLASVAGVHMPSKRPLKVWYSR